MKYFRKKRIKYPGAKVNRMYYPGRHGFSLPAVNVKKVDPKLASKNFRIEPKKPCPWCPIKKNSYQYTYFHSLLRHVINEHLYDSNRKPITWNDYNINDSSYVRVWECKYSSYYDVKIQGREQIEAILYHYCRADWNPSLRELRKT